MTTVRILDGVVVDYSIDGWLEYKKWLDGTYAKLKYVWVDEGPAYNITAFDGKVYRTFSINKGDASEFESDYMVYARTVPTNADGSPVVAERQLQLGVSSLQRLDDSSVAMNIDATPGAGGPYTFRLTASGTNECLHVKSLSLVVTASGAGWNSTSFGNIAGGLATGIVVKQYCIDVDKTHWAINAKNNLEMFGQFQPQEEYLFSDDERLLEFLLVPSPAAIVLDINNALEITIADDLSSLTSMQAFAHYGIEDVT